MSQINRESLTMGNRNNTRPIKRVIRVSSFGTAPLAATFTKSGANPGAFAVVNNCASVAPNRACNIQVTFAPRPNRTKTAVLTIDDNSLAAPHRITLTGKGEDTRRPRLASFGPTRSQSAGASRNVSVKFNEPVRGVKRSTYTLLNRNGNRVGARVSRVGKTNRYVLNPKRNLARGTTYRVRLVGGRAAIRDLGNNPVRDRTWTFRTR
jgi:hypothetical protein